MILTLEYRRRKGAATSVSGARASELEQPQAWPGPGSHVFDPAETVL